MLTIATWNVNSIRARLHAFLPWVQEHSPDIILLQELKCTKEDFPQEIFDLKEYNIEISGQKTYNSVAILSKTILENIHTTFIGNPNEEHMRFIEASTLTNIGYIRIICVYVPNGGEVYSDKFTFKLKFMDMFTQYITKLQALKNEHIIIGGDFNIAPFDIDVYSADTLTTSTCFTLEEKLKMRTILNNGYIDLYRIFNPYKQEYSWWDYRTNSFEYNKGMRIDMLLATPSLANLMKLCYMNKTERGKIKPSDHIPVIAVFNN